VGRGLKVTAEDVRQAESREEIVRLERLLRKRFGPFYDSVIRALAQHDPVDLMSAGAAVNEYEPEAKTILLRLPEANSERALRHIIHEEFSYWFGAEHVGAESKYERVAEEIWSRWRQLGERRP